MCLAQINFALTIMYSSKTIVHMAVLKKTISVRPMIWDKIVHEAKLRGVTISRCIEDRFEFGSINCSNNTQKAVNKEKQHIKVEPEREKSQFLDRSREMFKTFGLI